MFYAGLVLFFGTHLTVMFTKVKFLVVQRSSIAAYKGLFSLFSLSGFLLIIFGYENSDNALFGVNEFVYGQTKYFMFVAFIFLAAAYIPTHIRKFSKHPMLIGVGIWAGTHLLNNPDTHSVVLFGSFLVYSLLVIVNSQIRKKIIEPVSPKIIYDAIAIVLGVVVTLLVFNMHHAISGVSLLGQ